MYPVNTHQSLLRPADPYVVAVDIDGVLYELVDVLRDWIHLKFDRPLHTMPEPGVYNLDVAWDLRPGFLVNQLMAGVQSGFMFWKGEPHLPGLAGLRALKAAGHRVVLVSARDLPGLHDLCFEATQSWLRSPRVDAVYDDLILTSDKNSVQWDFLVNDYDKNVRLGHAVGRHAVLLNRAWNVGVGMAQCGWGEVPALVNAARDGLPHAPCCLAA